MRRKPIFEDEMDHQVLLQIIKTSLSKYNCWLHAYCLMTNHVHLLLETGDIEIGKFMKYMSECYAIYYNHKYGYSARVIHKLLRLARTSADLDGEEKIRQKDIEKVLTCRELDKSNSKMVVVK